MPNDIVKFGDGLELDRNSYELRRAGRALKLERIPLDILFLLVERNGQLVTREDIIGKIWGKDVFLDTDSSINGAIRKIRQVLRDDPENPVFVRTVTGKGYRFIAAVTGAEVPDPEGGGKKVESSTIIPQEPSTPIPSPQKRRIWLRSGPWIVALAVLPLLVLAAFFGLRARARSQSSAAQGRVSWQCCPSPT
jgi:DNA-binding winged helix-turn-helix (wHTH) protein